MGRRKFGLQEQAYEASSNDGMDEQKKVSFAF